MDEDTVIRWMDWAWEGVLLVAFAAVYFIGRYVWWSRKVDHWTRRRHPAPRLRHPARRRPGLTPRKHRPR
jgi:hypothetical protein